MHRDLGDLLSLTQSILLCCVVLVYRITQPQYTKAEIPKLNKALWFWDVSAKVRKVAGTIKKLCLSWSGREKTENGSRRGVVKDPG